MSESPNGRTHVPSLGEITEQLDGFVLLMEERDRRYEDRFAAQQKAVEAALASAEKLTGSAFAASEKAILKAETAQSDYNNRSNEFRGQLDDQAKTLMPRSECDVKFREIHSKLQDYRDAVATVRTDLMKDIANLRESRSEVQGRDKQSITNTDNTKWVIGTAITIAGLLVSMGLVVAFGGSP